MYQIKLFGVSQKCFPMTQLDVSFSWSTRNASIKKCHPSTSKALRKLSSVYLYSFVSVTFKTNLFEFRRSNRTSRETSISSYYYADGF